MKEFLENIDEKTKKLILKAIVILLLLIIAIKTPQVYLNWKYDKQPVKSIECQVVGDIFPMVQLNRSMFKVVAETPSGDKYDVSDRYTLDLEYAPAHGAEFDVNISYRGKKVLLTVPVTRTPIVEYSIGYPDYDDVKATIYTNGDLEFTGKGQIRAFSKDAYPWNSGDEIYSYVNFEPTIDIKNMDYWFYKNPNLVECASLPLTVESTVGTFMECTALKTTPDYFLCNELITTDHMFSGCVSLTKADTLPINVTSSQYMFCNCIEMQKSPDITKASQLYNITGMYAGCTKLIKAPQLPNSIKIMEACFDNCINIHNAAVFPVMVENIAYSYSNCKSLETATPIPESVLNYKGCFQNCRNLNGRLEINTDTVVYDYFLSGTSTRSKKLYLSGNCGYLIAIQQSAQNPNIVLEDIDAATQQAKRINLIQ